MKIWRYEPYLTVAMIFLAMTVNLSTFFYRTVTTPAGKVFAGTQFYSDDYAVYVADIRQGQEGRWIVEDKFTTEPHPASLIHEEYLLWGKLTGFLGIPPVLAYHLGRGVFGIIFLAMIYFFLLQIFPHPPAGEAGKNDSSLRIVSFLLICFSNGLPTLPWLTDLDATQRFTPVFHYLLGFIGMVGVFRGLLGKKSWLWLGIFGALAGFSLPSSLILIFSVLLIYSLFQPRTLVTVAFLIVVNLPFLLYYRSILTVAPWSHILAMESGNRGPFTFGQYILAIGPVAFLSPLAFFALRQRRQVITFLFSWLAASLLWSFWLADIFKLNPTRFLQIPLYIPLSILVTLGIARFVKKTWLLSVVSLILVAVGLLTSINSLKGQFQMYADYSGLIYPEEYFVEAFDFLGQNTSSNEAVLALYQAGNLIPFMAGNTVYLGHLQETLNYGQKVSQANTFFSGGLNPSQAKEFLKQNHLGLVFFGPQEKSAGGVDTIKKYPFLAPVFDNGQVTIFEVKL